MDKPGSVVQRRDVESLVEALDAHSAELHSLQRYRVEDVLVVASLYDSYTLSEGQPLAELVSGADHHLAPSVPPQVARVSTRRSALHLLRDRPFDLVITTASVADMSATDFGLAVTAARPGVPVFLIAYGLEELGLRPGEPQHVDGITLTFLWRGDRRLFPAMIRLAEDARNAGHDSRIAGVRTLILVEDSIRFTSSYLPMLFAEVTKQTDLLIAEGVNTAQRLLRHKLRPRILLATTYEEAWALYRRFRETLLCAIADVEFPRGGRLDPEAGLVLLRRIRSEEPDVPLLLQSSGPELAGAAAAVQAAFLRKTSPTLLREFRAFMLSHLGFGDFVFRTEDGAEVARAADVATMLGAVRTVPADVLLYHASRNHFSNWLMARTEFHLASALRRMGVADFSDVEAMRDHLVSTFDNVLQASHRGQVEDFDRRRYGPESRFVRVGGGSLGGKGRGLAFMHDLMSRGAVDELLPAVRLFLPRSAVIGTDLFDEFLERNELVGLALEDGDDGAVSSAFQSAAFPTAVSRALGAFLEVASYPLAVRSSSLLEDSRHLPAAGVYGTVMLGNVGTSEERLSRLESAIKSVYASTFMRQAKDYLKGSHGRVEDEKMAVVIQEVVGRRHGRHVYPDIAGVALSRNVYPVRDMRPEEGVAAVVLGLGIPVVEGGRAVRFSPAHPRWLPQFSTTADILANAQREFWAVDVEQLPDFGSPEPVTSLVKLGLDAAKEHGTLMPVASVYSPDNDAVYEGLARHGVPLVTFASILKSDSFALPEAIRLLLDLGEAGLSGPVEIEFAANLSADGRALAEVALLQVRPQAVFRGGPGPNVMDVDPESVLVGPCKALGSGTRQDILDIVAVVPERFDRSRTSDIAAEIAALNGALSTTNRPYLLIGPGRWGSADRWLGIPVDWGRISGARAIVELPLAGQPVEPSDGAHFFHNLTSLGVAYFTAPEGIGGVDWDRLGDQPLAAQGGYVAHFRLPRPLTVMVDGLKGQGVILLAS